MTEHPRLPLERTPEEVQEEREFLDLYGAWEPLTPAGFAAEMTGFDRPWWVIGGWAVEAATGLRREHEDLDVSLLVCDVPAFVSFMAGRWHVWNNVAGVLHPLGGRDGRWPTVDEPASQLWLRRHAAAPWVVDIPLTPDHDGRWAHKLRPHETAEVAEVTWRADDGLRYLRPEYVMLHKARQSRPKDLLDLRAVLPVLTPDRRAWLQSAVADLDPAHPWLPLIAGAASSVRRITGADWRDLREVRLRALADAPDSFGVLLTEAQAQPEESWRERAGGASPILLGFDGGRPAGMGGLFLPEDADEAFVWGMWVEPAARGRGLGAALLQELLVLGRESGRAVLLHVTEGNDGARRLYEAHGFRGTGEWQPLREGSALRVESMRLG